MSRPVTLFTGQWADVPLAELARRCGDWGFDGLELACWGAQAARAAGTSRSRSGRNGITARLT
jgi:sugar phosphate isomerase/epimerase